jgi:hypothetical protein
MNSVLRRAGFNSGAIRLYQRGDFMKRMDIRNWLAAGALILGLTACGGTAGAATTAAGTLNADYENALPVESQLILGTLQLEGTDNAVTADQAAELLPLWQMMKALTGSDTAAAKEKDGLIGQIEAAMTADQISAIAGLKLTQSDLFAYMQKAGLGQMPQRSGTPAAGSSSAGGSTGAGFPGDGGGQPAAGGGPGGMPGGGGPGMGGDQNLTSEQIATMEARRSSRNGGGDSSALLDALIEMLQTKESGSSVGQGE